MRKCDGHPGGSSPTEPAQTVVGFDAASRGNSSRPKRAAQVRNEPVIGDNILIRPRHGKARSSFPDRAAKTNYRLRLDRLDVNLTRQLDGTTIRMLQPGILIADTGE